MKATLLLCDAASAHPDGTFSLLRGGITDVNVPPNRPVVFRGALVARITGTRGEAGKHRFRIVCLTEDGAEVAPPVEGDFDVPKAGGNANICLSLQMALPRIGEYEFSIMVDGHQLDVWPLKALEIRPDSGAGG